MQFDDMFPISNVSAFHYTTHNYYNIHSYFNAPPAIEKKVIHVAAESTGAKKYFGHTEQMMILNINCVVVIKY